jgi:hypothetical protein
MTMAGSIGIDSSAILCMQATHIGIPAVGGRMMGDRSVLTVVKFVIRARASSRTMHCRLRAAGHLVQTRIDALPAI